MVRPGRCEPYDALMYQADRPERPPGALDPALLGPLRLRPFRARRLALSRVAGASGEADRSVSGSVGAVSGVTLDDTPALHVHEYRIDGRRVRGLVGLIDLDVDRLTTDRRDEAAVLPHEGVDPVRAGRLVSRMAELGLDPAPILLLPLPGRMPSTGTPGPEDPLGRLVQDVTGGAPVVEGRDARHHEHRLWRADDPATVSSLCAAVADQRFLLADGHHRWAAHLALEQQRRHAPTGEGHGDGRALAMVVDAVDHALVLHALHRVVLGVGTDRVLGALADAGLRTRRSGSVGTPAPPDAPLRVAQDEIVVADARRRVRVRVPHDELVTVVERLHRVLDPVVAPGGWAHHHRTGSALRQARREPGAVALILPPPPLSEVAAAATAGRLLPVKATSFQPKPPLGVLFRSWRDG